ncbi:MAG: phosphoglycerate kinase [SAR86 cluster bacterium]|uniref:Phosphoglycerate kinase n=1 Tax=SAR86 cluster bacterium TaxID=2030880 RepID=A0A2A5B9T6_9GAMM|nr:MAG: phosphoglycerate kinase [SAR86 cluster bacterium]
MTFLRMNQIDLSGKRVLIREDLNVPIRNGVVENDTRIRAALPTIKLALSSGAKIILMSHLGRPKEGVAITEQAEFSLQAVADKLSDLLGCEVKLIQGYLENSDVINDDASVLLLENVRINIGEKANDDELAKHYASLCEVFVMDAFGTAHRAQASTHGVAKYADVACAGPLLASELDALERSLQNPERPMLAVVGGAKVSSKLEVLKNLSTKVDQLIVGGGIANTFLAANGVNVGRSLFEPDLVPLAAELMLQTSIPLPTDVVVAKEFSATAQASTKFVADIEDDDMILDIGPETATVFANLVSKMKTIIWNGPLGVFEFDQFANGTQTIARAIADNHGFSIAGGGETISAIDKFSVTQDISYISTGGGAFLEYVQGAVLPAVQILEDRASAEKTV